MRRPGVSMFRPDRLDEWTWTRILRSTHARYLVCSWIWTVPDGEKNRLRGSMACVYALA